MKIKITDFALRHFDPKFGGTKILDYSINDFEMIINDKICSVYVPSKKQIKTLKESPQKILDGYAPFCKLVAIENFTNAKIGSMPITLENYQYIRSGYSARRESELPVFSRWLELPISKPKAKWLMFVLYNKEQINKENLAQYKKELVEYNSNHYSVPPEAPKKPEPFEADWGIVSIMGQSHSDEEPMKPETMIRNSMGMEEGGSGIPLDKEKYLHSVKFWSHNCTVK